MRRVYLLLLSFSRLGLAGCFFGWGVREGAAGAFLMPEGQGQIIAGVGYVEASRTFNKSGRAVSASSFRQAELSAYAEYGLKDWLTLVAAPTLARLHEGDLSNAYTGSDESAVGARLALYRSPTRVVAFQVLAEPPLGPRGGSTTEAAFGGPRTAAVDLRMQLGQAVEILGWPVFLSLEPGARLRGGGLADEARIDFTAGIRPWRGGLILLQDFTSVAPRAGRLNPSTTYSKLQLSFVYDLTPVWSVQVGGLRTLAGRNAALETGPLFSRCYRFYLRVPLKTRCPAEPFPRPRPAPSSSARRPATCAADAPPYLPHERARRPVE